MKKLILLLVLLPCVAHAQDAPAPIAFTFEERQVMLKMCDAARWAARINFDGACDALKAKFAEADKLAEKPKAEDAK